MSRCFAIRSFVFAAMLFMSCAALAFPMKPDVKALINEAKRPAVKFIPARAGWNGPEEKPAKAALNPTYEQLRREPTAAEVKQQLIAAAIPDWRVFLMIAGVIVGLRMLPKKKHSLLRPATVIAFPATARLDRAASDSCAA